MSHIVTIQTKLRDPVAIAAACRRLQLPAPVEGTARLYSGTATGLLVSLSGWRFPLVVDTATGTVQFDHFQGAWGAPAKLDQFVQAYTVEKCRSEARAKGYAVTETPLADGSVQLQILEAA
ncbi:hypothetical protein AYO44_01420 [Planctomycetaceae bacterium SCGC AG-212-F19]|nr:hypothetical protein AYO44_01420 [Planctomycetaceae bacterium SCGC AG-212-F19]